MHLHLQSGFSLDGEATTTPDEAPETRLPLAPMLFKTPCRDIGVWEVIKESTSALLYMGYRGKATAPVAARREIDDFNKTMMVSCGIQTKFVIDDLGFHGSSLTASLYFCSSST
jgi:hypothetical protein